jgi:hypothetical protein
MKNNLSSKNDTVLWIKLTDGAREVEENGDPSIFFYSAGGGR